MMQKRCRRPGIAALWLAAGLAGAAAGEPLDLSVPRARPVRVALESSPPGEPARLDHRYGAPAPGWFEPGPGRGRATVRVAGADFEKLVAGFDPVPGSFRDFLWVFDVETGHVLSARVSGAFHRRLSFGLFETRVRAEVAARMTTLRAAGFRPPRKHFGQTLFEYCGAGERGCRLVAPRAYDGATGYVNAVGSITARAVGGFTTTSFSPLGEAVFSEAPGDTAVSAR